MITQSQDNVSDATDAHVQPFLKIVAAELADRWIDQHEVHIQVKRKDSPNTTTDEEE